MSSRIAVMQPYLFPYIGYFQLINAVDKFVFYDDVDFIKNGWINRNRILINGDPKYFTVPCKNVSSYKKINNTKHALTQRQVRKLRKKIEFAYKGAPFFEQVYGIVEKVFERKTAYISELAIESVKRSSEYLGLKCSFVKSSEKYRNVELNAADRLIDICKTEKKEHYINPIGGQELYEKKYFREKGISLQFLNPKALEYEQFGKDFVPWLAIIDVMMFNSPEKIRTKLLTSYKLI